MFQNPTAYFFFHLAVIGFPFMIPLVHAVTGAVQNIPTLRARTRRTSVAPAAPRPRPVLVEA